MPNNLYDKSIFNPADDYPKDIMDENGAAKMRNMLNVSMLRIRTGVFRRLPEKNIPDCAAPDCAANLSKTLVRIQGAMTGAKPACNRHYNAEAGQRNKQAGMFFDRNHLSSLASSIELANEKTWIQYVRHPTENNLPKLRSLGHIKPLFGFARRQAHSELCNCHCSTEAGQKTKRGG
ncbi:MAG: hypothetical protein BECKG1743D_GA0114223_103014 [Candidatus Kentron sp. G]|nr:MAG: hypothetical protein BECKG1743E_GA0114224_101413 [Candidatus Kentron sp. G]VFN00153.1 MAG: hypothetical protein BECKG1743F_GA0114225_104601 [Candidatus Kentron sp. G]VFN01691.1 MAG: hypothetical protein BECKG1743D_GA0114223_103014 [Candidatus Kentron sp. G]